MKEQSEVKMNQVKKTIAILKKQDPVVPNNPSQVKKTLDILKRKK